MLGTIPILNQQMDWVGAPGAPRLARPTRAGPCLDFGFPHALIRNNRSKQFGVEYWALPGSNTPWRPWVVSENGNFCRHSVLYLC